MSPPRDVARAYFPAGIIALSLTEPHHVSPHKILVEKERAHIAGLIQESFTGLADISAKASATVSAFTLLSDVLREGRTYFYGDASGAPVTIDPLFSLRRSMYAVGKLQGFDKTLKHLRRRVSETIEIEGRFHAVSEVEEIVETCRTLEKRRIEATHSFSRSIDECIQRLSKDIHLQNTLCAITGLSDGEKFTQERKDWAKRATKHLFEWNNSATTAHTAFTTGLTYDGWLVNLAKYKEVFSATASDCSTPKVFLSEALSPEKKHAFAHAVVNVLDDIARLARKHSTMPESPIKDILRIHFALSELEKNPPEDVAIFHSRNLEKLTSRLLEHPDCSIYLIAVECDTTLPEVDKALILRHFTQAQSLLPAPVAPTEEGRIVHEKRTRIRRELKESLDNSRSQLEVQELLARMQELRESSSSPHPKKEGAICFFPQRLQQEFDDWLAGFQEFVQVSARELLKGAAKGDRVDFKPIPIEKKIFELRLIGGSGIRVYCTRTKGGDLVVLGFGTKTSQHQDILTAHERYRNLPAS